MTEYKIVIGDIADPDFTFENENIVLESLSYTTSVDVVGAELAWDEFRVTVMHVANADAMLFSPRDYDGVITADRYWFGVDYNGASILDVPYGTPICFYRDEDLEGQYYISGIVRVGVSKYQINAMSAVGFLDNQMHDGGIYIRKNVGDLIDEIIGGAFDYTLSQDVAGEFVTGWLPIATRRENLHKLMFAMGISLTKDSDGGIVLSYLEAGTPTNVPDNRIFIGGNVDYNEKVSAVEVTEHSYYQLDTTQETQLFDNSMDVSASFLRVDFTAPHFDLRSTDGLTINESHENYAIVSGNGVLYGKPYTMSSRVLRKEGALSGLERVISSSSDTLVSALNSENVARRLLSYYSSRKTISASLKLDGERPGQLIQFHDPFGDEETGFISKMDTVASSFLKSSVEIITDYTPTGQGNFYRNRELITTDTQWSVPSTAKHLRIVLIGGGSGGDGGKDGDHGYGGQAGYDNDGLVEVKVTSGQNSSHGWIYENGSQKVAYGGAGGNAGIQGKVYSIDIDNHDGSLTLIDVAPGAGGAGGAVGGGTGSAGTATQVRLFVDGSYGEYISSDDGTRVSGYVDPFSGNVYAEDGVPGISGGDGGQTDIENLYAANGEAGFAGGDAGQTAGGSGGQGVSGVHEVEVGGEVYEFDYWASGGGGGGAAHLSAGAPGTDGAKVIPPDIYFLSLYGGDGGDGADAVAHPAATYGSGGAGGNGGGAGGNGAGCRVQPYSANYTVAPGDGGAGGSGTPGGDGGAGLVIIYY